MIDIAAMLDEFHAAFGQPFGHGSIHDSTLRRELHEEEHRELVEAHARLIAALDAEDLAAVARELADVVYVAYGTAHSLGLPLDDVIREVHGANMTKFPGGRATFRPDGKVLKPPTFRPPDVAGVLARYGIE